MLIFIPDSKRGSQSRDFKSVTEMTHGNRGTMANTMFTQQNDIVVSPVWSVKYDSFMHSLL